MADFRQNVQLYDEGVRVALGWIIKGTPEMMVSATAAASKYTWKKSQKIVPVETGALKRSGRRKIEYKKDLGMAVAELSYGFTGATRGYAADASGNLSGKLKLGRDPNKYAAAVHEMTGPFKDPTTPGTEPKYLEKPVAENRQEFFNTMGKHIRFQLKVLAEKGGG